MNKIFIVIEREFMTRVRKKSFILLTILMPILFVGVITVPVLLSTMDNDEKFNVALIDHTGKYAPLLKDTGKIHFMPEEKFAEELRSEDSPYTAVIVISKDLSQDSLGATIYSRKEVPVEITRYFNSVVRDNIRNERMASYGIPDIDRIIAESDVRYEVRTVKWTDDGGEKMSDFKIAGLVGMLFTLLIYMFVLSYGSMVMQGVMEEKTNRIMEIMVSSVKPFQMMMGKIIGVALVGLFQFLIWGVLIAIGMVALSGVLSSDIDPSQAAAMAGGVQGVTIPDAQTPEFLQIIQGMNLLQISIMFVLYFIGGYLLYASFFAAIGASINEQADSSQFMMPIVILMIFALYAGMFSIENPDGPLALWCSYFPLTSPIVMMVRLPFSVPVWQLILSLVLLYATAILVIWLSAKIYRVGILMYGKKPSFKEMARWIRFK